MNFGGNWKKFIPCAHEILVCGKDKLDNLYKDSLSSIIVKKTGLLIIVVVAKPFWTPH